MIKEGDFVLRKNEAGQVDSNKKLDTTWEGLYWVIRNNGNGCYKLQDCEGKILAKAWNDANLKKFFP